MASSSLKSLLIMSSLGLSGGRYYVQQSRASGTTSTVVQFDTMLRRALQPEDDIYADVHIWQKRTEPIAQDDTVALAL
jgi:hypothetical protein